MANTDPWILFASAFGGGLLGAVAQPLISHGLELVRSDRNIRRERERSLRRMIMAYIRHTRKLQAYGGTKLRMGQALKESVPIGGPFWEPNRIKDQPLHDMVVAYNKLSAKMVIFCIELGSDATFAKLNDGLNELQSTISARMDELNWPEAELPE